MTYRFFVALAFMVSVFPFAMIYSFKAVYPEAHFGFDRTTWLSGLILVAFSWTLFLAPGLIPGLGPRYYRWAGRKTGLTPTLQSFSGGLSRLRSAASKDSQPSNRLAAVKSGLGDLMASAKKIPSRASSMLSSAQSKDSLATHDTNTLPKHPGTPLDTPLDGPLVEPSTPGVPIREKLASLKANAAPNIAEMRSHLSNMFTPDERQREIVLNLYTLRIYAHLRTMIELQLELIELEETLAEFASTVCAGIPLPPSPGSTEVNAPQLRYVLPERHRRSLVDFANRANIPITEQDFAMAEDGDLEKALLILKAVLLRASDNGETRSTKNVDPLEGLAGVI